VAAPSLKEKLGCWVNERWRTELVLRVPNCSWLDLCNRGELIYTTDDGRARRCTWPDTSQMTVCRVFPSVGARLLNHCLAEWPIKFSEHAPAACEGPEVSIIIAFRGIERLAQLKTCLATLQSQQGVNSEIILVEQSRQQLLNADLLPGVRLIHARSTSLDMPFNKSWAMNVGARHARAGILIFHDGDILAPAEYVKSIVAIIQRGFHGARIPRLVFYPDRSTSEMIQAGDSIDGIQSINEVRQNCRGISLAMEKEAYWSIGGHDESFYGWGGEDDEILQRAETLNFYPGGFMPFVHLWHPAQKEKHSGMGVRESFSSEKMNVPICERISKLKGVKAGMLSKPNCMPTVV